MSKFSEYVKNPVTNNKPDYIDVTNEQMEDYEELLNKYSRLSKEELMQEFLMESKKLKASGGLQSEHIESIESALKPHLNSQQQSMFDSLISEINNDK